MSKKQEFIDATTAAIYTNGQEKVKAQVVQYLLNNTLATGVVWSDNQLPGFGAAWTMIDETEATPSTGQFSTDGLTLSGVTNFRVHKTALGTLAFDDTLNKVSSFIVSSYAGLRVVFKVTSIEEQANYVIFNGAYKASGTLTSLVLNDSYYFSFLYGDGSETISNYFCTSWAEVKSAVILSNASNGGNIYMSGDIILTESPSWDVTNIKFIGSSNCRWRVLNTDFLADGTQSKYVTITAGSTTFKDVQFRGSGGGASSQTFLTYSSRPLFVITSGDSDLGFENCQFQDIIGGVTNPIIEYTSITASTGSFINLDGCSFYSRNNGSAFTMAGFQIKATSNSGNLNVSVVNQKLPVDRSGTGGTDLEFNGDFTTPANVNFFTDGTGNGSGDFSVSNSDDEISILQNDAGDLSGYIRFRDTDGVMKNMTLTQLKTLLA